MADCQNSNERLFGGAVVLEVADGCSDTPPQESEWKVLTVGTSKVWDFSPNKVTSDADDDGGDFVESIITNSDFTISFEGEVSKKDKLYQYGVGRFIKYFAAELQARRQLGVWVRMEYGEVTFPGYMVVTALSSDGGTNDIVTFSTKFKVGDATTIQVLDTDETIPATGFTVTPATANLVVGATRQLTGAVQPTDATDRTGSWTTSDAAKATVSSTGLVTAVAVGSATITFTSTDCGFIGTTAVTVTAS